MDQSSQKLYAHMQLSEKFVLVLTSIVLLPPCSWHLPEATPACGPCYHPEPRRYVVLLDVNILPDLPTQVFQLIQGVGNWAKGMQGKSIICFIRTPPLAAQIIIRKDWVLRTVAAFYWFSQWNLIVGFVLTIQLPKAIQPQFTLEFLLGRQICEIFWSKDLIVIFWKSILDNRIILSAALLTAVSYCFAVNSMWPFLSQNPWPPGFCPEDFWSKFSNCWCLSDAYGMRAERLDAKTVSFNLINIAWQW